MARAQTEILARFREAQTDLDDFGWQRDVLAQAMDLATLKQAGVVFGGGDWKPADAETEARNYLSFAIGKIQGHRGISASRSVVKLREYAWLLCRGDALAAMDAEAYPQYGAPKIHAFAAVMGWPWPDDDEELARMVAGEPCTPDCHAGCGT